MKNMIFMAASVAALTSISCNGPDAGVDLQTSAPGVFKNEPAPGSRSNPPSWTSFNDPQVRTLVSRVRSSNTDLKVASAQARQFLALIRTARSASRPSIDAFGSGRGDVQNSRLTREFSAGLAGALEIDLWGRLRKMTEAASARAVASEVARDNLQLVLETQAVSTYYTIKALDSQIKATDESISRMEEIGRIADREIEAGLVGTFEAARVDSAIGSLRGDQAILQRSRNRFENALAVLVGSNPSSFSVNDDGLSGSPPSISTYLPSSLLERRPDIAEAKALLDANQADIGIAWADFFPRLNLLGLIGLSSPSLDNLFRGNEAYSVGADLVGPVIDGGLRRSTYDATVARRDEALAALEGTVLRAFEDTENALSDSRVLNTEYQARKKAVANSRVTIEGVRRRHRDGIDSLFQLVSIELRLNVQEVQMHQAHGAQFVAAADTVRALGGDWRRQK